MVALRWLPGLSRSSSTPVTVTVRGVSQSPGPNVSVAGDTITGAPAPADGVTVTAPPGAVSSTTP